MRKLYASDDRFLLQSVRSELDARNIPYLVKNEFAGGAVGELPWQDTQQEIWVVDEQWFAKATAIVDGLMEPGVSPNSAQEWRCPRCREMNGAAFDYCWQCEEPRTGSHVQNS
ncbi:DUF2007 domain-containing protein [Alteromonas sp. ASW11-19]|uniref:DUF2007 domain-containing protein n=1 Tax=Alteromonas salexigens TaxID=2982530 RepID=A0ABT2VRH2_9ALTE|nr:DUF2007 domain-containing protein [Alteromonas salexigens]MCU7555503.1 DUF2007 domain-containing protein [Alteromonas salexigens]